MTYHARIRTRGHGHRTPCPLQGGRGLAWVAEDLTFALHAVERYAGKRRIFSSDLGQDLFHVKEWTLTVHAEGQFAEDTPRRLGLALCREHLIHALYAALDVRVGAVHFGWGCHGQNHARVVVRLAFRVRLDDQKAHILDRILYEIFLWMAVERIRPQEPQSLQLTGCALRQDAMGSQVANHAKVLCSLVIGRQAVAAQLAQCGQSL